jgi:hypothetical protein
MKILPVLSVLLSINLTIPNSIVAQIIDPKQRNHWFYLQKLSTDLFEIESCQNHRSFIFDEQYNAASKLIGDELGREVISYINQYANGREASESLGEFHLRVWRVTISVGMERKRELREVECSVRVSSRTKR